jgi:trimeric autotransporter adhesin
MSKPTFSSPPGLRSMSPGLIAAAALIACGGGSESDLTVTPPQTTDMPIRVLDGPIQHALVCLDANGNSRCDSDEVQGRSDAEGRITLKVPSAELGRHVVLAQIGTDAIDKDHGPVSTAFMMTAPADAGSVVSPLSTLVQIQAASSGSSTAAAEQALQQQLSIDTPLLGDFSQASDAGTNLVADLARLLVLAKQQQLGDTAGATDSAGQPLSAADIEAEIDTRLLALLPELMGAAIAPALQDAATAEARAAAMLAAAKELAQAAGLSKNNLATLIAQSKAPGAPEEAASAPKAGLSLRWFTFSDPGNYYIRTYESTAAQNTPDAQALRHYTEYRETRTTVGGVLKNHQEFGINRFGEGSKNWLRNQVFWTGTEWFDCPAEHAHQATPWDAQGRSESLYCKAFKSSNKRTLRSIAGIKMGEIVTQIRAHPPTDNQGSFAGWGPDPQRYAAELAAPFPAGSVLITQDSRELSNPDGYSTAAVDRVYIYVQALRGGERASCDGWTAATADSLRSLAADLESLVAAMPGTPCSYTANPDVHGSRNEAWGATSLSLGNISDAAFTAPSNHYRSGLRRLRVSFAPGNTTSYWTCVLRASDDSARNCDKLGSGSYSIETLGDARVLRLAKLPPQAAGLGFERLFVERGGKVFYGFRDKLKAGRSLRLNLEATEALGQALSLP